MKIKNNSYNFGRCLKITFTKNVIDKNGNIVEVANEPLFRIQHSPEIDERLYVAMDVTVSDRPSAHDKDNPGFQGTVTIYNPTYKMLEVINQGATWVQDYINGKRKNKGTTAIKEFYASRLTCTIEAGYLDDNKQPQWNMILKGFVNGSSVSRVGVEEVLKFGVFDIDMMQKSHVAEQVITQIYDPSYSASRILDSMNKNRFEATWYTTLIKYIREWETYRQPTPRSVPEQQRLLVYDLSTKAKQEQFPSTKDMSRITEEERPFVPVSEFDRKKNNWFEVRFVNSLTLWQDLVRSAGRDWDNLAISVELEEALKTQKMPKNGAIYGTNLAQMLDGLCAVADYRVGWYKDKTNRSRNTYVIYPLGTQFNWVDGKKAGIKIWNYQNLLESPSVSGAGIMTVKMVFNPECVCGRTIALMLDRKLISEDGVTRDLSKMESGDFGSMGTSADLATYGTVQLGSTNALAAISKQVQQGKSRGYMFNVGFPIMSVKHELSTHKNTWSTTIQTVPVTAGLNNDIENLRKRR